MNKESVIQNHIDKVALVLKGEKFTIRFNLRDYTKWSFEGRTYVGYKRINDDIILRNVYRRYYFKPLSALTILKRKAKVWIKKLI